MSWGDRFWVWWGWTVLAITLVTAIRVATSPRYRTRSQRGGRSLVLTSLLVVPAVLAIVLDRFTDIAPSMARWAFLAAVVLLPVVMRRRLASMPAESLSPMNAAWLERPGLTTTWRQPLEWIRGHSRYWERYGELRRADKAWDRQQDLLADPETN